MQFQRMVVKRFQIPPLRKTLLQRKRIIDLLSDCIEYPITVVMAGAGFGKTTAVSSYAMQEGLPIRWFTLTEEERDPASFVEHFMEAMLPLYISTEEIEPIHTAVHHPLTWNTSALYVAKLMSKDFTSDVILVMDDFHIIDPDSVILNWIDTCIQQLPFQIHLILISRTHPTLKYLTALEMRGEVLWIRERDLVFTTEEIDELFRKQTDHLVLAPSQLTWLMERTGGVAISLSVLWRAWRQHHGFQEVQALLDHDTSLQEQLGRLLCAGMSEHDFSFFVGTSVLSTLSPDVCDFVLARRDSVLVLQDNHRRGLLSVDEKSTTYSLHPLLREYFQQELRPEERQRFVRRTVDWFYAQGQTNRAISYLFSFQDESMIVPELLSHMSDFLQAGQLSTVNGWLQRLSSQTIQKNAGLLYAKAEICRYQNQYPAALAHYEAAQEIAGDARNTEMTILTLCGLTRVYLDTIQPSLAERFIREASRLVKRYGGSESDLRLQIVLLSYENAINSGRLIRARRLQQTLEGLGYHAMIRDNSDARLLLRTGQHQAAVRLLSSRIAGGEQKQRTALAHREATLILSLLHSMLGNDDLAETLALKGTQVGDFLDAPFVSAVGLIRLGHAEHLADPLSEKALRSYQRAIQLMDEMSVVRGKAEALMGLSLVHAYRGQFESARETAERGIAIARAVEDVWMENLVRLAFGQACVVCGNCSEAVEVLTVAEQAFIRCGDPFLQLCSVMWRSIAFHGLQDERKFSDLEIALSLATSKDYTFVFTQPTYFGIRDIQMLTPILSESRAKQSGHDLAARILHHSGGDSVEVHPGYTLRVQTLGGFRVWRGFAEVTRREWQREKARQLFQFLVTHRGISLHREEIAGQLWGIDDPEVAERDFKVALNVLSAAIEPKKIGRGRSVFIERHGGYYQLIQHPILRIDRDDFETRLGEAVLEPRQRRISSLKRALNQYTGEYLPDARYEGWCHAERERLKTLYTKTALLYINDVYQSGDFYEVICMSEQVTAIDTVCEEAYVWLMRAYGALQMRPQIIQTYRVCETALKQEFGVEVMESTRVVYQNLLHGTASSF